jgi:septal ring factor EnvC (AmiA/AmiB activator)
MEAGNDKPVEKPGETDDATPITIDGLRAWVAQLDRKLGTRFYALGAATVLALAAGIVGIVLVLGVKEDSATKDDLKELRGEVAGVERSASEAARDEVAALGDRVSQLESQVQALRTDQTASDREISVIQDDIADLRDDVTALESAGNGGGNSGN